MGWYIKAATANNGERESLGRAVGCHMGGAGGAQVHLDYWFE